MASWRACVCSVPRSGQKGEVPFMIVPPGTMDPLGLTVSRITALVACQI